MGEKRTAAELGRAAYVLRQLGHRPPAREPEPRDCVVCETPLSRERRKLHPTAVTCNEQCSVENQYRHQLASNREGQRRRRRLRREMREAK